MRSSPSRDCQAEFPLVDCRRAEFAVPRKLARKAAQPRAGARNGGGRPGRTARYGIADHVSRRSRRFGGVRCVSQLYAFVRSICCRARKTILSPALMSPDTVHRRKATLSGSMRTALQNVSSPNWCCSVTVAAERYGKDPTASFRRHRQIPSEHAPPPRELLYYRPRKEAV
jgi:hypothetical protein